MKKLLQNKEEVFNNRLSSIHESVFKIGDTYKVKTVINVPKSLVNAFVSKAKKSNSVDPRENWSDTDLVELFITYITSNFLNIESLPVEAILGEADKSKEEVTTVVSEDELDNNEVINTPIVDDVEELENDDNITASVENMDEGLMDTLRGGSKEEIAEKEKTLMAKLDELMKANQELYFNGKPLIKDDIVKTMKKNNFLGNLSILDAKYSKSKKTTLTYKPGVKGMAKLAGGSNGARS